MRRQHFSWLILLLVGGLLVPATPALADSAPPIDDGVVIWNEDYTLEQDQWLDGDLVVFNGDATLEDGSRVEGSVIVWNGSAGVEGTVEADLVVSNGDIDLSESAWVQGDVICSWNCQVKQGEGARVDGRVVEGVPLDNLRLERWRGFPWAAVPLPSVTSWASGSRWVLNWTLKAIRSVVTILVIAAVAGLVALIWPQQTAQVGRTVVETPGPSFGMGLLTIVAATALIIMLAITICLSPLAVLGTLALGAAGLFGWIGIGALIGERLLQALNAREVAPLWAAGLGTLLITLIGAGLSAALCLAPLGWLLVFILGCLGLGAVVLTRFGTTRYVPSTGAGRRPERPTPPPSAPAPVEAADILVPPEEEAAEEELPTPPSPTPAPAELESTAEPPEEEAAGDESGEEEETGTAERSET